jgi:hypothetical protein
MCFPPPDAIVDRLRLLDESTRSAGNLNGMTTNGTTATGCRRVPFTDDARILWHRIIDKTDTKVAAMASAKPGLGSLWRRHGEHVAKVALVLALSADPSASAVDADAVAAADELVTWCLSRLQRDAESRLGDSDTERRVLRVLGIISEAGPEGLTSTVLTRRTQWLSGRDRKDAVDTLLQGGRVHSWAVQNTRPDGKGKPTTWFAAGAGGDA